MNKTINNKRSENIVGIGIIGCGSRATHVMQNTLKHSEQLEIRGLYDPNPQSITHCRKGLNLQRIHVYESEQDLCNAPDIDWVVIGSPNVYHAHQAMTAMEAGKHVFCEKPLATTLQDCLDMRDTQNRTGLLFYFGLVLRHAWMYRQIKRLLDEGTIGHVLSFELNETLQFNHGGFIHQDWRRSREVAGTHLLEKCCHDIDIANWIIGSRVARVASFGGLDFFVPDNVHHVQRIGPSPEGRPAFGDWFGQDLESPFREDKNIVDNQVAILEYQNKVRATFHTNCMAGIPERRMYLVGTEGALRADLLAGKIEVKRVGWETPYTVYGGVGGGHGGGDHFMGQSLSECMLHGCKPKVTLSDGLNACVTCFAIDQAMDIGKVVDLQSLWEQVDQVAD
jgi:predicted dehydrogenase